MAELPRGALSGPKFTREVHSGPEWHRVTRVAQGCPEWTQSLVREIGYPNFGPGIFIRQFFFWALFHDQETSEKCTLDPNLASLGYPIILQIKVVRKLTIQASYLFFWGSKMSTYDMIGTIVPMWGGGHLYRISGWGSVCRASSN